MSERKERCETCRFWRDADPADTTNDVGWCRRHAPVPRVSIGCREKGLASADVLWPFTTRRDWCGEWQTAEPVEPVPDA